ncbi:MAG: permease-like cell division protein FtsX [Patescibacteria group bacterium]
MFVSAIRAFKFAFQNFWRNFWLSLVTIFILFLTLLSISVVALLNYSTGAAISAIEKKVDLDLYFFTDASQEDVQVTQKFIEDLAQTKSVTHITKEEAKKQFIEKNQNDPALVESIEVVEDNPFPDSFVIQALTLEGYDQIVEAINGTDYKEKIEEIGIAESKAVIERLTTISDRVRQVGFAVSGIFVIIAILVVFNTIRITIYSHREELGIMKLVGATNMFVRVPFIIESVLYAIIAATVTVGTLYPVVRTAAPYVNGLFEGYEFNLFEFFSANFWKIFLIQLGVALVLCVVSSMVAISRYLRV